MSMKHSTEITPFVFEDHDIRVLPSEDGTTFSVVAKDVCESIGILWNGLPAIKHVPEEWRMIRSDLTIQGLRDLWMLSEEGLYF